jgi:hypothetical protein
MSDLNLAVNREQRDSGASRSTGSNRLVLFPRFDGDPIFCSDLGKSDPCSHRGTRCSGCRSAPFIDPIYRAGVQKKIAERHIRHFIDCQNHRARRRARASTLGLTRNKISEIGNLIGTDGLERLGHGCIVADAATTIGCNKLSASEEPDPGRHHVGTPGDIISECPGDFIGIRSQFELLRLR